MFLNYIISGGEGTEKPSPSSKPCKISSIHGRSLSADSGCAKSKTKVSSQKKEPSTKKSKKGSEPGVSCTKSSIKKEEKVGVTNIRKKQSESMTQKSDKKNPSPRARSLSPTKCSSQKSKIQLDKGLKVTNKSLPVDNIHLKIKLEPGKSASKVQFEEKCILTSTKKVYSRSRSLSGGRPQQLLDKCDGDKHVRSRSKTPTAEKSNRSKSATSKNETPSVPRNYSANSNVITSTTENSASTRNKMTSHANPASDSAISNSKISIFVDEAGDRKISPGKKETAKQNIMPPVKALITKKTGKHDVKTSPGKKDTEKKSPQQNDDIISPKKKTIKSILKVEVSTPSVSKMTFSCKLCPKSFTTRMGYKQHCKRSHKIDANLGEYQVVFNISSPFLYINYNV